MINPTDQEKARRADVMGEILACIRSSVMIKLPDFDPALSRPAEKALLTVGQSPNPFCGTIGPYRYQFEGEEDLLHLIVTRIDEEPLTVQEAQEAAGFLLNGVSPSLIWLKPGEYSQHFYLGHDELTDSLIL